MLDLRLCNPSFIIITFYQAAHLEVHRVPEFLASVDGVGTELLLDTEDLVQLGQTLRAARGAGLDLAGAEADSDVSNGDILGLTRAVGDHDTPATGVGVLGGLNRLGETADLVDLEQEGVAGLQLDGLLDADGVGDRQVVTALSAVQSMWERGTETHPTIWKSEVLKK